jgi:hypothetical protein
MMWMRSVGVEGDGLGAELCNLPALTRVYGGPEVRPAKFLTGYIQFIDAHALGLPLQYVATNQPDIFDDRQAYLKFHLNKVEIFAGRQELKDGSERLVSISDWTNTISVSLPEAQSRAQGSGA